MPSLVEAESVIETLLHLLKQRDFQIGRLIKKVRTDRDLITKDRIRVKGLLTAVTHIAKRGACLALTSIRRSRSSRKMLQAFHFWLSQTERDHHRLKEPHQQQNNSGLAKAETKALDEQSQEDVVSVATNNAYKQAVAKQSLWALIPANDGTGDSYWWNRSTNFVTWDVPAEIETLMAESDEKKLSRQATTSDNSTHTKPTSELLDSNSAHIQLLSNGTPHEFIQLANDEGNPTLSQRSKTSLNEGAEMQVSSHESNEDQPASAREEVDGAGSPLTNRSNLGSDDVREEDDKLINITHHEEPSSEEESKEVDGAAQKAEWARAAEEALARNRLLFAKSQEAAARERQSIEELNRWTIPEIAKQLLSIHEFELRRIILDSSNENAAEDMSCITAMQRWKGLREKILRDGIALKDKNQSRTTLREDESIQQESRQHECALAASITVEILDSAFLSVGSLQHHLMKRALPLIPGQNLIDALDTEPILRKLAMEAPTCDGQSSLMKYVANMVRCFVRRSGETFSGEGGTSEEFPLKESESAVKKRQKGGPAKTPKPVHNLVLSSPTVLRAAVEFHPKNAAVLGELDIIARLADTALGTLCDEILLEIHPEASSLILRDVFESYKVDSARPHENYYGSDAETRLNGDEREAGEDFPPLRQREEGNAQLEEWFESGSC